MATEIVQAEPCGICDVQHRCCCPRMKSFCSVCVPPTRRIAFNFRIDLNAEVPPTRDPGAAWLRAAG